MKLKQLLKDIPFIEVRGSKEIDVLGLSCNSKLVAPGFLFFAKKGSKQNGNQFIQEAILAGAVGIVTDLFDPFLKNVVQVLCKDVSSLEAVLSDRFYRSPSRKLLTVGITGTNGKTTCSYLVKHLFNRMGLETGLIGTIEWAFKDSVFPSNLTTPDVITCQKLLHEMVVAGCQSVVMEVSSHALSQGRVDPIDFDLAIFTNLTQDHLDYHSTMQEYAEAKAKLFTSLGKKGPSDKKFRKRAIVNQDSPWTKTVIKELCTDCISYGLGSDADLYAQKIKLCPDGMEFEVCYQGERAFLRSSLIGKFNVYNLLAAAAAGLSLDWKLSDIVAVLSSFKAVPGRLERVENAQEKNIFVDYAHTEDALQNALMTLREIGKGKLICVFGCGGNRDRLKRPKMGHVAEEHADLVFVTSDNPRGERPEEIIREILLGIQDQKHIVVEVDRKKAIQKAVEILGKDDILLIAGKGHENYQIFSHHTIHFDDRIVAKEYCR